MKLKNAVFFPELVLRALGVVPAPVIHNIEKSITLKMAFWHLAVDQVEGAYVEFGVASGNSMRSAELAERGSGSKSLGVMRVPRELVGFDTFNSFSTGSDDDLHQTWEGSNFSVPISRVKKRFRRAGQRVSFHAVDCSKLGDAQSEYGPVSSYVASQDIAIVLMDMDLGDPTEKALDWIRPKLRTGTIVIFDEYFAYGGDPSKGEAGAWTRFLAKNPEISGRIMKTYGDGGAMFQISIN
jgi:O-methyltransferase